MRGRYTSPARMWAGCLLPIATSIWCFRTTRCFPILSVYENVAFPLRMRKLAWVDIERKVSEALALVFNPGILLMDEPLGALDKNLRQSLQLQIKQLHQELGLTVVFVTHDQEKAMNLSDTIVIMDQGNIVDSGRPEQLYQQPAGPVIGVRPEHIRIGEPGAQPERSAQPAADQYPGRQRRTVLAAGDAPGRTA